jgi:hypothetical protein
MEASIAKPTNYLNATHGAASWFLTKDHKRIALLYLISVSAFFLMGGIFASLIRMELLTPAGDFVSSETYNKFFTMHGVMMVFFFLIPSIPATLGNFLVPMMIGAKDLAFPRINLLSWYIYLLGGMMAVSAMVMGGVDTGWTFYTPYSTAVSNTPRRDDRRRHLHRRLLVDPDRLQLHRHHPHHARAGDDLDAPAAVHLGPLRRQPDHDHGHARDRGDAADGGPRAGPAVRLLRPDARRRPGALPAPVLVLLAPGRLHHGAAGHGRDQRAHRRLQPQAGVRLLVRRRARASASPSWASSSGGTTCSRAASRSTPG